MIEWLASPAMELVDWISWRWLLQIVLLSLGLTLACRFGFSDDSRSRRSLGVAAIWLLVVVPLGLAIWQPRYQIGLIDPPTLPDVAPLPALLVLLWALIATIGGATLLGQVIRASRGIQRLPALSAPGVFAIKDKFCARLNLSAPTIVVGERCCASSIGRPTLVVPAGFASWPATAQRSVIAHELVHLHRHDDRFMVALQLIARCYLFCPWLRGLYQYFVHALEEACDERAAELVGSRALYLEGLAEAALRDGGSNYQRSESALRATAVAEEHLLAANLIDAQHQHSFMQRLARLLGKQKFFEVQSGALAAGLGIGLLVLGVVTTFEFVAVPKRYLLSATPLPLSMPLPKTESPVVDSGRPASASVATEHEVQVVLRFPNQSLERDELVTPAVIYPGSALLDAVEGEVLVEFSIAADGSIVQPRVVHSTHPRYFNRAAIRAVRQAVFAPLYSNGFSGVKTTDLTRAGELLAVRNGRATRDNRRLNSSEYRVQKLFLFRLRTPGSG